MVTVTLLTHRENYSDFVMTVLARVSKMDTCQLHVEEAALFLRHFLFLGYTDFAPFCRAVWRSFAEGDFVMENLNVSEQSVLVEALATAK